MWSIPRLVERVATMLNLEHRVRVYVFQLGEQGARFLWLRPKPSAEWPLVPVVGAVGLDEHLQDAIVREVREETGIQRPVQVFDLRHPTKELFGDMGLVEWPFAYQAAAPHQQLPRIVPGPRIGEFHWFDFESAYQQVEGRQDRENLVRLQIHLQQAG